MSRRDVAVVGGGLAGLAAALELAEAGATVTLLEARPRLGGATFSIRRGDHWLDNGQHVALRCCTEYLAFLGRLGVADRVTVQPRLRIPVLGADGTRQTLVRSELPAPLHLAATLARYGHLTIRERLAVARAVRRLRLLEPSDPALDAQTFGTWLRAHGQSGHAVSRLWDLFTLPALNLTANEASLGLAVKVFRTGLLDTADGADIVVPTVPLQELHAEPASAALQRLGARVETSARVRSVEPEGTGLRLRLDDRTELADAVVVAVPHDVAASLLPSGTVAAGDLARLGASPIVNLHLHYDRVVLDEPIAAAVDSPVQWLFDRTRPAGIDRGQLVGVSLSGAGSLLRLSRSEVGTRVETALATLLPETRGARLLDLAVTREPRATFRAAPGTRALRPGAHTSVPGLFLAGAWTATGWPATMEGAVRSGRTAARSVLGLPDAAHDRRPDYALVPAA